MVWRKKNVNVINMDDACETASVSLEVEEKEYSPPIHFIDKLTAQADKSPPVLDTLDGKSVSNVNSDFIGTQYTPQHPPVATMTVTETVNCDGFRMGDWIKLKIGYAHTYDQTGP